MEKMMTDLQSKLEDILKQFDGNVGTIHRMDSNTNLLEIVAHAGLPPRSTTALRTINQMPFRIDLAGGWSDQPFVSKYYPGSVITISLEPTIQFNERSGMASSN